MTNNNAQNSPSVGLSGEQLAVFGAALSSLVVLQAPAVEATIVELNIDPSVNPYIPIAAGVFVSLTAPGTGPFVFFQYNDLIGKSMYGSTNLLGIALVNPGSLITTGQGFNATVPFSFSSSGTATIGFLTTGNQVGWLQFDLGGPAGDITYLAAAFNDEPDGSITAGQLPDAEPVPEPAAMTALAALSTLALGKKGVRRLRQQRQKQAA